MRSLAALFLGVMPLPALAQGFSVEGRQLLDATGEAFVMRGINHAHAWQRERTAEILPEIAATGANIVRVALSNGSPWGITPKEEVAAIIAQAKALGMIVMLEVHNTTGYGQQDWGIHLAETLPYWFSLKDVLDGEEAFVLINMGNEPTGNTIPNADYVEMQRCAIKAMRAAGFTHTLVVDGHNWGQDHSGAMRDAAPDLFAADPMRNTIFSVHMYQVYAEEQTIRDYIAAFAAHDLPLIVGEFGPDHQGEPVDEETIFRLAEENDVGWLGWSWSGNSEDVADLDIVVDFDPDQLSPWGEQIVNGPYGIRATAEPASDFPARPALRVSLRGGLTAKGSPSVRVHRHGP